MKTGKYYEGLFNDCAAAMLQAGLLVGVAMVAALALISAL